jgi:small subunit ribosomal protein S6
LHHYELIVIIGPQIEDEGVPEAVDQLVRRPVEGWGGQVEEVNNWGRRKLAYPIRQQTEGSYVLTQFRMAPQQTTELERGLRISENVIRHLLVRLDA